MASIKVKKCGSIIIRFRNPVNRKQKTITVPFAGTSVETKQIADIKKAEVEYKITRHKAGLEPFRLVHRFIKIFTNN